MGFLEKIMNVRATAADGEAAQQPQGENTGLNEVKPEQTAGQTVEPQSYAGEELEKLLESKKAEWLEEQVAQSQEYLSSLPEAQRLRVQQLSKDEEIAKLKVELSRRDLEATVIAKLDESKLPVTIAQLVQYSDEKGTMESLEKITAIFSQAVADGVNMRLRGKTPAGLGGAARAENSSSDQFAKAFADSFKK